MNDRVGRTANTRILSRDIRVFVASFGVGKHVHAELAGPVALADGLQEVYLATAVAGRCPRREAIHLPISATMDGISISGRISSQSCSDRLCV